MKRYIILSFVSGAFISWIAVGKLVDNGSSKSSDTDPKAIPERISILGGNSGSNQVPDIQAIDQFSSVSGILSKIDSASPEALKRWLMSRIGTLHHSRDVVELIIHRLASLDTEGTFNFLKDKLEFRSYYDIVLSKWAESDLSAALDAAFSVDPEGSMIREMMHRIDISTRREMFQSLLERDSTEMSPGTIADLFHFLAEDDPQDAAQRALEFTLQNSPADTQFGVELVLEKWYKKSPEAASKWVMGQEDPESTRMMLPLLAAAISRTKGVAALEGVWNRLDDPQRIDFVKGIDHFNEDIDMVLKWANDHIESPVQHRELLTTLLNRVATQGADADKLEDMATLISHWEGDPSDWWLTHYVRRTSQMWAEQDSATFEKWLETLDDPNIRKAAELGRVNHWLNTDPIKAIEDWERLGGDIKGSHDLGDFVLPGLVEAIFDDNGNRDPKAMLERVPEAWREDVLKSYVMQYAENAPADTLRFLEEVPSSEGQEEALQMSLSYWVTQDASQAAEWVDGLPAGDQRDLATRNLVNNWTRSDPKAAIAWIEDQPSSRGRDIAIENVIKISFLRQPRESLSLAMTLSNAEARDELVLQAVSNLARRDPDLAKQQIPLSNLPPSLASQLNEAIEHERALRESFEK